MDARAHPSSLAVWQALLPDAVRVGLGVPWLPPAALDHVGDPDGERVALWRGDPLLVPRLAAGHLRLTGDDRVGFTQGLVSNDVQSLAVNAGMEALLLDHRGQVRAGVVVYRRPDDLFLWVEDGAVQVVEAVFEKQIVFDRVTVTNLDDRLLTLTLVAGDDAAMAQLLERAWPGAAAAWQALAAGETATFAAPSASGSVLGRRRVGAQRVLADLHLLSRDAPPAVAALVAAGARLAGERAVTAWRVAAGVPSPLAEGALGLPQETGLQARVHPRKGCYVGQEIMARIEARGNVHRALVGVRMPSPPPALGAAQGWRLRNRAGREVGALGSAAPAPDGDGWWGLAVVRRDALCEQPWQLETVSRSPQPLLDVWQR